MKISYDSSIEDHIAFTHWLAESQPGYKRRFWVARITTSLIFMIPAFILLGTSSSFRQEASSYSIAALAVVFGLYAFIAYPEKLKARRERCVRNSCDGTKTQAIFCRHTLEFTDDMLKETTAFGDTDMKLSAVTAIVQKPDYVFVMLGHNGAYVIPRAKMETGDLDAFTSGLQAKLAPTAR